MPGEAIVSINSSQWAVSLATTPAERYAGLSNLPGMTPGTGMFFDEGYSWSINVVFDEMLFPLDIAFIDSSFTVVDIYRDVAAGSTEGITPSVPARFFLEVNAGEMMDVSVGDLVEVAVIVDGLLPGESVISTIVSMMAVIMVMGMMLGMMSGMFVGSGREQRYLPSARPSSWVFTHGPVRKYEAELFAAAQLRLLSDTPRVVEAANLIIHDLGYYSDEDAIILREGSPTGKILGLGIIDRGRDVDRKVLTLHILTLASVSEARGVGRAIVEEAIRLAAVEGRSEVTVVPGPGAAEFYRKLGFVHDPTSWDPVGMVHYIGTWTVLDSKGTKHTLESKSIGTPPRIRYYLDGRLILPDDQLGWIYPDPYGTPKRVKDKTLRDAIDMVVFKEVIPTGADEEEGGSIHGSTAKQPTWVGPAWAGLCEYCSSQGDALCEAYEAVVSGEDKPLGPVHEGMLPMTDLKLLLAGYHLMATERAPDYIVNDVYKVAKQAAELVVSELEKWLLARKGREDPIEIRFLDRAKYTLSLFEDGSRADKAIAIDGLMGSYHADFHALEHPFPICGTDLVLRINEWLFFLLKMEPK